jgi:hypothetical protein
MQITNPKINEFLSLYSISKETMQKAGNLLVEMILEDEDVCEKIKKASAGKITDATLHLFIKIGQGHLLPELVTANCPAYKVLRKMPVLIQRQLINKGAVPMLIEESSKDFINVELTELSKKQVDQVFARTTLRSIDEQAAYLRRSRSIKEIEVPDTPYVLYKDRIEFKAGCSLTIRQLAQLVAEST